MAAEFDSIPCFEYEKGAVDPDVEVRWRDSSGVLIAFESDPHTFRLVMAPASVPDEDDITPKTSGFIVSDEGPNVRVRWAAGELNLTPGFYLCTLGATQVSSGRARNPIRFRVRIRNPLGSS